MGSDDKAGDLDISSIGAIYSGQWEKKYWSSSRGKDRHPYPVGYHAVRTHAGNTCRMEIHEGVKGPVFVVSSIDGESSTGQTPDIAWENFQKKSFMKVKNWQGRRFSSKIDGAEFFGFRNPFVLRLFRELVANVNDAADRRSSKVDDGITIEESPAHPSLHPLVERQQNTGKRSKNHGNSIKYSTKEARFKRARHQGSLKDNTIVDSRENHISSTKVCAEIQEYPGLDVKASAVFEKSINDFVPGEDMVMETEENRCLVQKKVLSPNQSNVIGHDDSPLFCAKTQLKKSLDATKEPGNSTLVPKEFDANIAESERYLETCVPDTCETAKDDAVSSPERIHNVDICSTQNAPSMQTRNMYEGLPIKSESDTSKSMDPLREEVLHQVPLTQTDIILKQQIKDSLPEVGSSSSNTSTEKIDLDVAGQELARSMMTFLLPRAVPLLKKTYVRRRSRHRSQETKNVPLSKSSHSISKQNEIDHQTGVKCRGMDAGKMRDEVIKESSGEKITGSRPLVLNLTSEMKSKDVKSVIPDSFEDDQIVCNAASKNPPQSGFIGTDIVSERNEDNITFLELFGDKSEGVQKILSCTGNDSCNGDEHEKSEWLSDSVLADVDPDKFEAMKELTDCCLYQIDRYTDNMPLDPNIMHSDSHQLNPSICNVKDKYIVQKDRTEYCPLKKEESEQDPPDTRDLADDEAPKSSKISSQMILSTKGEDQGYSLNELETRHNGTTTSSRKNYEKGVAMNYEKEDSTMKVQLPLEILPTDALNFQSHKTGMTTHSIQSSTQNNIPLSESIICRQKNTITTNMQFPPNVIDDEFTITEEDIRIINEVVTNEQLRNLKRVENNCASGHALLHIQLASQNQEMINKDTEGMRPLQVPVNDLSEDKQQHTNGKDRSCSDPKDISCSKMYPKSHFLDASSEIEKSTEERRDSLELLGCYIHPSPVLSISLTSKEDGLRICVVCGLIGVGIRNIFIYMVPTQERSEDCPTFLGYTSLVIPLQKDPIIGNITSDTSCLCFAPDGQSLVFSNNTKAPRCRENDIDCSCKDCTSDRLKENTVEIVQVNLGYVSSVAKLNLKERVSCMLVCEPNYLIAGEESAKLRVWTMNLEWSAYLEEFLLPNSYVVSPTILELKRIPNSDSIIGHNCLGDFGIWDISKRVLVAKFSSPGSTIFQIHPVGLLNCHLSNLATISEMKDFVKEMTPISSNCSETVEEMLRALSNKEMAVLFLVSAVLDSDIQIRREKPSTSPTGSWRLALFMKNKMLTGSILDHRISAVTASVNYGIHGTNDGLLCKWKLFTGEMVENIHPFECGSISSIKVDPKSGAVAVANDCGQLQVYVQSQW